MRPENNSDRSRFELREGAEIAVLLYDREGDTIRLKHTEVPAALRGKGVASSLARSALEYAREERLVVNATCPFVRAYIRKHPEYRELTRARR